VPNILLSLLKVCLQSATTTSIVRTLITNFKSIENCLVVDSSIKVDKAIANSS
jgi:hypothetical protein